MARSQFLGSADDNAIILQDIFPLTDITFSTQLMNRSEEVRTVVLEGDEEHLRFIQEYAQPLTSASWIFGDPVLKGDTELRIFKKSTFPTVGESVRLLVCTLREELQELCKFVLADRSRLLVRRHRRRAFEETFDFSPPQEVGLIKVANTKLFIPKNTN